MTPAAPRTHVRAPSSPLQPNYSRTFNVLYRSHSIFTHVHNSRVVEWLKICHLSRALAGALTVNCTVVRASEYVYCMRGVCIVLNARCVYISSLQSSIPERADDPTRHGAGQPTQHTHITNDHGYRRTDARKAWALKDGHGSRSLLNLSPPSHAWDTQA